MNRNVVWIAAGLLLLPTGLTSPAAASPCPEEYSYNVEEWSPPEYLSTASPTGQRNGSSETSTLSYSIETKKSRSTNWAVDGGMELGWGIAKVESHTKYDVTNTVEKGVTVSTTLSVPGEHYGYVQPKVEFRRFHITYGRLGRDCKWREEKDYGVLDAITAWPFFSTCVDRSPCTPSP